MKDIQKSPFMFLDAFEKKDKDLFFGREEEVEYLYDMTYDTSLIVFFGASGTGKTSIIQCGLANKFSETRWLELYIRRDSNINQAILDQLNVSIRPYQAQADIKDPIEGLRLLHKYTSKPIFITFDQFEELFILQPDAKEQEAFFLFLKKLLDTRLACKAIIVMREEFIAHLWDYEPLLPTIFDNHFRIKQLEEVQMKRIIEDMFDTLQTQGKVKVEEPEQLSAAILKVLSAGRTGLGLTYLQVLLDRLYRRSVQEGEATPNLNLETVEDMGTIEDVIDEFLEEQLLILEAELGPNRKGIPLKILGAMVSNEQTKKVLEIGDMESLRLRYNLTNEEMNTCLQAFETMRIVNRYES